MIGIETRKRQLSKQPMGWVEIFAPAKVNLFLELLAKRSDGFHELETVMATVALFDRIRLTTRNDDQFSLKVTFQKSVFPVTPQVPTGQQNLVIKAIKLLRNAVLEKLGVKMSGCHIWLHKGIPVEAGLGGGSSDAATTLMAGCQLWQVGLSRTELVSLAQQLGSDVPFFLYQGTAICRGRGERVFPLGNVPRLDIVIAKPISGLSTASVFQNVKVSNSVNSPTNLVDAANSGDRFQIGRQMFNRLQESAIGLCEDLPRLADCFENSAAYGHLLSGSGTSYFGLFTSSKVAQQTAHYLSARLPQVKFFSTSTLARGVRLSNN